MAYIIAHRANGSKYKENTKEAFLEVLSLPYVDGSELDVQMTKDKKFILSHNSFVICKNKKMKRTSKATYKQMNACQHFDLLDEILKMKTSKILILDLKINANEKIYMKYFLKLIEKYKVYPWIASFNYEFVKKIKKKCPKLKVGYIKGYFLNQEKRKENLDFCMTYYKKYCNEEGVWTVNKKEEFKKYKEKSILLITDYPEFNK